ncbi:peptidylprolyl isomerase [Georhizobium profundi]|uniref:Parvulin-like PPIase n=2 Tax=Georhizobium profundi TaxID=2341112 RepID=A0A3Q8XPG4_9HYPH|nr:peptidylprolyl isomerase [Georhizobium profundi]
MLTMLRRGAQTWVAKGLFFLLVASFAVWGVSGSMFSGGGDTVVSVGETEVSALEFRLAYDRQLSLLSQQFGTRITTEQARAFGIENQVYSQLVAGAALDEQARNMQLGLSEDRLAGLIAADPAFQGINGQFSRQNFAAVLRNVGMSEDDYIRNRQQVAVRTQVVEALADGFELPDTLLDAFGRHRAETRTVDYLIVDESMIDPIGEPSDEELAAYFEDNGSRFTAPEYRSIAYVTLTASDIADPDGIDAEVVRAEFDNNADRYTSVERRTLDQLVFPNREAAEAAAVALAEGTSFDDVVAEAGRTAADVRIGTFARNQMTNAALAEAAFAVDEAGGVTDVVDGPFGPVIMRVAAIEGGEETAFEDVEAQIREDLAMAEAAQTLFDVFNAYEDARAGGLSVQDAAREQQLTPVVIEAVDRSGRTPEGDVLSDLPQSRDLLAQAFDTDIGIETQPINLGSDGYLFFEVLDIEEARDRTLDEVRDDVVADWQADQRAAALAARAEELRASAADGTPLAEIATELGATVRTEYNLQRDSENATFGPEAIAAAFAGPGGHVATAPAANGAGEIVMRVNEVAISASNAISDQERAAIARSGGDDLLDQLVTRLQAEYPVRINQQLGTQALGF